MKKININPEFVKTTHPRIWELIEATRKASKTEEFSDSLDTFDFYYVHHKGVTWIEAIKDGHRIGSLRFNELGEVVPDSIKEKLQQED